MYLLLRCLLIQVWFYQSHCRLQCSRRIWTPSNMKRRSTFCSFLCTRAPMVWTSSKPLTCCWWSPSWTRLTSSRPLAGCTASDKPSKFQVVQACRCWCVQVQTSMQCSKTFVFVHISLWKLHLLFCTSSVISFFVSLHQTNVRPQVPH